MQRGEQLLIFGASARAAAFSALRAGFVPWCVDLFADADLSGRCASMRLPGRYPDAFRDLITAEVAGPWMYTGALENYPALVSDLAKRRKLWGIAGEPLTRCREPSLLANLARRAGLPAPEIVCWPSPPTSGRWLLKTLRGAGGRGVRFWSGEELSTGIDYLQEFVEGEPASALYAGIGGAVRLLGVTRQLCGEHWLNAPPFSYCGNIGPIAVPDSTRAALRQLGLLLADDVGLRGLFGVDGILKDGDFWPIEVNPRYTAAVEVIEHATGLHALALHRAAFLGGPIPEVPGGSGVLVGKAVLYARQDVTFPDDGPWRDDLTRPVEQMPNFADLPHPGEHIESGRPVLTLFARADTVAGCVEMLRHRTVEVESLLFAPSS
jgi:predicted ATP-grasp superfamily ATP-dependent carboligase